MGYSTSYSLKWEIKLSDYNGYLDTAIGDVIEASAEMRFALERDGSTSDSCKWYDHEANLKALSKSFPGVLFTLSGEGEESGDIWKKYFRDGKMQICKAVIDFPKFDAKLLK